VRWRPEIFSSFNALGVISTVLRLLTNTRPFLLTGPPLGARASFILRRPFMSTALWFFQVWKGFLGQYFSRFIEIGGHPLYPVEIFLNLGCPLTFISCRQKAWCLVGNLPYLKIEILPCHSLSFTEPLNTSSTAPIPFFCRIPHSQPVFHTAKELLSPHSHFFIFKLIQSHLFPCGFLFNISCPVPLTHGDLVSRSPSRMCGFMTQ